MVARVLELKVEIVPAIKSTLYYVLLLLWIRFAMCDCLLFTFPFAFIANKETFENNQVIEVQVLLSIVSCYCLCELCAIINLKFRFN